MGIESLFFVLFVVCLFFVFYFLFLFFIFFFLGGGVGGRGGVGRGLFLLLFFCVCKNWLFTLVSRQMGMI